MIDTPRIIHSKAQFAAVIALDIPRAEMMQAFGPAVSELLDVLAAQGLQPNGSAFAHHLRMPPGRFDVEVGFRVSTPVKAAGRVRPGSLPAATVARTVHHGGYEGLPGAWNEFMQWIAAHGHTPAQNLWEWYAVGPHLSPDPAQWRTELSRPVLI